MLNAYSPALIQEASALIESRTGLACQDQSRIRLDTVLADLSGGDLAEFVRMLRATPETAPGWQNLMRALVIGETYFLRNRAHFNLLASHILPEIMARQNAVTVWSAGCSTGEEAYSLAITLRRAFPDLATTLIATDINETALDAARLGIYREWAFRQTDADFRGAYFDAVDGGFRVKPFIRAMASFRAANLVKGPPLAGVDVIFCCNVLLYFEAAAAARAEDVLYDALAPGGWLILSPAEALRFRRARWMTHLFPGAVAYQKPLKQSQADSNGLPPVTNHPVTVRDPQLTGLSSQTATTLHPYAAAVEHFRAERYAEAAQMVEALLAQDPRHIPARTLAACLCADRGEPEAAERHLKTALDIAPLYADAHYLNGLLLLESEDDEGAMEAFRAAMYCQRGHALAAMILGGLYARQGDESRARRAWKSALDELADTAPTAYVCDLSDMTAESVVSFLTSQLDG